MRKLAPDLAHLVAGVLVTLAACALALCHIAIPSFVPFAALTLLGIGGGLALPQIGSKPAGPVGSSNATEGPSTLESRGAPPDRPPAPLPPAPAVASSEPAAAS